MPRQDWEALTFPYGAHLVNARNQVYLHGKSGGFFNILKKLVFQHYFFIITVYFLKGNQRMIEGAVSKEGSGACDSVM